jgi:heme/copper-type cytochrome/quinol oxidase subunit 1
MTTIDTHAPATRSPVTTAGEGRALDAWITSTDHKTLGRLVVRVSLLVLIAGAVLGTLLAVERIDATDNMLDGDSMTQLFSLYRIGLTFGVLLPALLGVAVAVVPLQVGARSIAFPRLVNAGAWAWIIGLGMIIVSIAANGGPAGGNSRFVALYLASLLLLIAGVLAVVGSLGTTILTSRAPGMNMRRVPPFTWSVLVTVLGLIVALPVFAGTTIYVYVDYRAARSGFGGNTGIMQWLGFGSTQMMTVLFAVPVFGFLAEVVATGSRRRLPLRGILFAGIGLVGVAALGAATQTTADLSRNFFDQSFGDALGELIPYAIFNLLPLLGGLIVLGVCAVALLQSARLSVNAPLLFGLGAVLMLMAALGANLVDRVGDAQLAGTVFEEGVWVYVVYGAALAVLGALAYWGPKLTGRGPADKQMLPLALLGLLATVLSALPDLVAGFAKQPAYATEFDYGGPQGLWNVLSAVGHALMAVTVVAFVGLYLKTSSRGDPAGDDPFDGQTLEWATSSPPPYDNFTEVHVVTSPEPLLDLKPVDPGIDG